MKRSVYLLMMVAVLCIPTTALAYDVYKTEPNPVPDADKSGVPPAPNIPGDNSCWQAGAANLLGGGGWGNAQTIYNTMVAHFGTQNPGWLEVAMKWWLHTHGLNPSSPFYNATADYTNVHIHNYPSFGTVADYHHLLAEMDECQYVVVGWIIPGSDVGHCMTLVGGNFWGNPNGQPEGNVSVWHNSDADGGVPGAWVDDEVYVNSFPGGTWKIGWNLAYEARRSVVLCPGLRKPENAVANFDAAWYISGYDPATGDPIPDFILTGEKAPPYPDGLPPDPDDYEIPRWDDDLTLYIDNEHIPDLEKLIYVLVDYHDPEDLDPNIFVVSDDGTQYLPDKYEWTEDRDQLLLTFHLDYQPGWEQIIFPDETYHDLDGNVFQLNVATVCVPEPCTILFVCAGIMGLVGVARRSRR